MALTKHEVLADMARPARTLGEVIDALLGRKSGMSPSLDLEPLPADVLPDLVLPDVELEQLPKRDR